jgi:hypothetical protein
MWGAAGASSSCAVLKINQLNFKKKKKNNNNDNDVAFEQRGPRRTPRPRHHRR